MMAAVVRCPESAKKIKPKEKETACGLAAGVKPQAV
jgi:hypothetical protein